VKCAICLCKEAEWKTERTSGDDLRKNIGLRRKQKHRRERSDVRNNARNEARNTRKELVATVFRCEGVYNRAEKPSETWYARWYAREARELPPKRSETKRSLWKRAICRCNEVACGEEERRNKAKR
jgi:hypothetical protein